MLLAGVRHEWVMGSPRSRNFSPTKRAVEKTAKASSTAQKKACVVDESTMAESKNPDLLQDELDALNAKITKQGSHVRTLKKGDGAADDIADAVKQLQALKIQASSISDVLEKDKPVFDRKAFDDVILRKMFIIPSFEIHGGVKGLFDLGPPSTGLKVRADDGFLESNLYSRRKNPTWRDVKVKTPF